MWTEVLQSLTITLVSRKNLPACFDHGLQYLKSIVLQYKQKKSKHSFSVTEYTLTLTYTLAKRGNTLMLTYFGLHVLRELQYGVHSGPGIWVVLQVGENFLCQSLL